ncbi:hypothetical protein ACQ4LE_001782, partial [Meloidogyne hapla]|uniref:Uncharacterized protein n=1 Tax=Meloidogyne hapla TaxID=6305 RepID=A0A1I8C0F3_MELHA
MFLKKSFYFIFLLIFIFQLLPSFYCFKGLCEILKLVDVGEASNDGSCSNVPNAEKRMDRCCIRLNCKMVGMIEVGSPDENGNCEGDAQFVNNHCCDIPPCTKNEMDDVGPGMEGVCDGEETKYIRGRCCINKKEPPPTTTKTTTTPPTTTPLGLYVNGHFYMNCIDKRKDIFCQNNINICMRGRKIMRNRNQRNNRRRIIINKKFMAFNCCYSCQKAFKDFLPTLYKNNYGNGGNNDYDEYVNNDYVNDDDYVVENDYNNNNYGGNDRRRWGNNRWGRRGQGYG